MGIVSSVNKQWTLVTQSVYLIKKYAREEESENLNYEFVNRESFFSLRMYENRGLLLLRINNVCPKKNYSFFVILLCLLHDAPIISTEN